MADQLTAEQDQPQENPPFGEQDDEGASPPRPRPDDDEEENVDRTLSLLFSPHEGQGAVSSSPLRKHSCSKTFPHFVHLNS